MYPEFVEWLILSHQKIIKNEDLNVQAEIQQNQRLKMLTHKFLNPFFFAKVSFFSQSFISCIKYILPISRNVLFPYRNIGSLFQNRIFFQGVNSVSITQFT